MFLLRLHIVLISKLIIYMQYQGKKNYYTKAAKAQPMVVTVRKKPSQQKEIENIKKNIKGMKAHQELGIINTLVATTLLDVPAAAQIVLLNGLQQGDTKNTRDKDLAQFTSLQFKGYVQHDPDSVVSSICRIMLVWDKFPKGAAPVIGDMLNVQAPFVGLALVAPYNEDNFERFHFIMDKKFVLNPNVVATTVVATGVVSQYQAVTKWIEKKIKLSRTTNYGLGNAGTIADISKNSLYIVCISNIAAGVQPPSLAAGIRLYFKDD